MEEKRLSLFCRAQFAFHTRKTVQHQIEFALTQVLRGVSDSKLSQEVYFWCLVSQFSKLVISKNMAPIAFICVEVQHANQRWEKRGFFFSDVRIKMLIQITKFTCTLI